MVEGPNGRGYTALDLAKTNGHDAVVTFLESQLQPTGPVIPDGTSKEEWSECYDPTTGQMFYYHQPTGTCQWDKPDASGNHVVEGKSENWSPSQPQAYPQTQAEVWTNPSTDHWPEQSSGYHHHVNQHTSPVWSNPEANTHYASPHETMGKLSLYPGHNETVDF